MYLVKHFNIINKNIHNYPIIISLPHSGTFIPKNIKEKMNEDITLSNTDWFLCDLYDFIKDMNVTLLQNYLSRYVIDVNRKIDRTNTLKFRSNLVFQKTYYKNAIYKHDLSKRDIEDRIRFYYEPYHNALNSLIDAKLKIFKKVYLLDLHSYYPEGKEKENIIISNRNNKTSTISTLNTISDAFKSQKFKIIENDLFLGGHITNFYASKYKNKIECLQIELPYNIYIENRVFLEEEVNFYNRDLFYKTKKQLNIVFNSLIKDLK